MHSLKHQIIILLLGSLIVLATSLIFGLGWHLKHRAVDAAIVKAKTDLTTCMEIIDLKTPGSWQVKEGLLYKGDTQISHQTELVDYLAELTGDTVTLFLGDTRVATTVRSTNGERAIGTKVSDAVAQTVLKDGQIYLGEANVVGQLYQTAYEPIRDSNGDIVGIFYVGISKNYTQAFIVNSLTLLAGFGLGITSIVALATWFFIQRVIINPLRDITLATRDVATGHAAEKVDITGPKEIGDLAVAFNQMVERLGDIADEMSKATMSRDLQVDNSSALNKADEPELNMTEDPKNSWKFDQQSLPKGLNQLTLMQILSFMCETRELVSAENVAEGVNLTRVTVRRYLEFLEQHGALTTELKYGTVGRPVKLFQPVPNLSVTDID
ncbi:cache domain-containing protein [Desulfosporosinus meridiei]|uniref:Response regulator of citrate/malate metabolism n=1 Tax=Desulfosporosinus meridiei (strain ATCC BAA-275 / DSM 13257 / KCTC 12902 / NCIMB 13706 / S10) TaxID=768704 RepID=J7IWN7_DESMD|nr:cache domain-containing protein [Desulfosporosinus meridiei]AFQ43528.1 response regulator of citrate/malate metabolism [Desulfosporosinus meridiei DSM 13257]